VDTAILIPVTNSIEALNAKLRRAVRARGHFPSDEAALKLLFLVLNRAAKAQFAILFEDRFVTT
jgi:putative transposase